MVPILYQTITEGTVPTNFGIGALTDTIEAKVTEVRNGEYELEMTYAAQGIHASDLVPNTVIKAKPNYTDDPQLFRIYKVGKTLDGRFTVNAQHISYDLSGKVITTGTAGSCSAACALLQAQAGNFTITTDKTLSASFNITEPSSVRSWFGGKAGSILDVYGPGEWKYDNFGASFLASRGTDRGVTIRYGKNLTELSQVLDMSNLVSGVIPYYKAPDGTITTGTKVATGLTGITRDIAVDFSSSVDPESATPIATQLGTLASSYISSRNLTTFLDSIELDFVQMKELSERVDLCDTVHIYFEPLGITATMKCIKTVWDVLQERYVSTEFGDARTSIADTIASAQKEIDSKPSVSIMNQAITHATELITGNLGGYVVLHDSDGNGEPDEILIMDDPDISQAVKVWRWNMNGLAYSSGGYSGPYNTVALTNDGQIVATAITTGTLNANLIKAGVISDVAGNSSIDMTNGEAKMKDFKAINSLQLIDENDLLRAAIKYVSGTGESLVVVYNSNGDTKGLIGTTAADQGQLELYGTNDALQALVSGGSNGGLFELKDVNGDTTVKAYNETNGGGRVHVCDKGSNESEFVVWDSNSDPSATMKMGSSGDQAGAGAFEVYCNGDIMGQFYGRSVGGSIVLWGTSYQNITLNGYTGEVRCISLTQTSSRKVKENIKPMTDAKKILELDAVSFDYKSKERGTDKRGFIAEDVEKVLPNLVKPEEEDVPASLDYIGMIPYLQAVIKDQEKRITELEKKINGK